MNSKDDLQQLLTQAGDLVEMCKRLDYQQIIAHKPEAVAALKDAMRIIRGSINNESLGDYANKQEVREPTPEEKAALLERRRLLVEVLGHAGLAERMGKIYSTEAAQRLIPFKDVPHKQGLPQFDLVVGPDFSPQSGFHGIFIGEQEVMSCLLPSSSEAVWWQVRERHRFTSLDQAVDIVGLLSAGFPVT
ncbi:MAG: hypothetical protein QM709_10970 [Spongiibacteraceae bacterium]